MLLSSQQNQLLVKIREILDKSDTIIFVGSGISRWSGLPSWYGLVEELANFIDSEGLSSDIVRKELKTNDLLQAASYGTDLLTKPQFREFIRRACRTENATPHDIHKEIISLGPSCFITTNYDQLLERSFSKWNPDKNIKAITNNQLTEIANIIQAKSSQFIFKPHGDVNDSDNIILSREDYRKLNGEKPYVLRALETLLASRPVVFLGFGLRDLDFLYIKDVLANIYKGGLIDHYALMADISEQERTYWRKNFGIHILSYSTTEESVGHQALMNIVQSLNAKKTEVATSKSINISTPTTITPDKILAIARYSANIAYSYVNQSENHIPLSVSRKNKNNFDDPLSNRNSFDHSEVEHFLEIFPQNAILIGNPGSGKSYSLRNVLHKLAQDLQSNCLKSKFESENLIFPFYIDLKLYEGGIFEMINKILPPDFPLENLSNFKEVRFFLDSYNELPVEFIENGKLKSDLDELIKTFKNSRIIVASRFEEGLIGLDYPVYQISNINYSFIEEKLDTQLTEVFRREIINLLQKPLFYRLYKEKKINLVPGMTPTDIYKSFTERMSSELSNALERTISLDELFKPLGYEMLSRGTETVTLDSIKATVDEYFAKNNIIDLNALDIINWLISQNFIIPSSNYRLSFFHQTITEYFASLMLSQKYKEAPDILDNALKYTRWDQCIYLTLSFLSQETSLEFVKKVISIDLTLATKSIKYLEHNQDEVVSHILNLAENFFEGKNPSDIYSFNEWHLKELPVTRKHEEVLYRLLEKRNTLGAIAATLLIDVLGSGVKNRLINELFEYPDDFNYCSGVGGGLQKVFDINDFRYSFERVKDFELPKEEEEEEEEEKEKKEKEKKLHTINGLAAASANLNRDDLYAIFEDWKSYSPAQIYLICRILQEFKDDDRSWKILIEMVCSDIREAIFPLYLITAYPDKKIKVNWLLFDAKLTEVLVDKLELERYGYWAANCLELISKNRVDLQGVIKTKAVMTTGLKKAALLFYSSESKEDFWTELKQLAKLSPEKIKLEPVNLFHYMPINWVDNEGVLIDLLETNEPDLVRNLFENLFNNERKRQTPTILDCKPLVWWLEWATTISSAKTDKKNNWWILYRFGSVFSKYTSKETHQLILQEFNNPNSVYRKTIKSYLLASIPNLSLESFDEEGINYLVEDLRSNKLFFGGFNLGNIATESFVEKRLLPLLETNEEPLKTNLLETLAAAGRRNDRRFVT